MPNYVSILTLYGTFEFFFTLWEDVLGFLKFWSPDRIIYYCECYWWWTYYQTKQTRFLRRKLLLPLLFCLIMMIPWARSSRCKSNDHGEQEDERFHASMDTAELRSSQLSSTLKDIDASVSRRPRRRKRNRLVPDVWSVKMPSSMQLIHCVGSWRIWYLAKHSINPWKSTWKRI